MSACRHQGAAMRSGPSMAAMSCRTRRQRKRNGAPTRDYFRAEDSYGRRFWLYREGLWGRETAQAKWFVHGVFG